MLRIGKDRAQRDRAGRFIHRHFGQRQATFFAVGAAIFKSQGDVKGIAVARQALLTQAQQIDAGSGEIDVHRIQAADRRQRGILIGGHQRARRDGRDPDAPGNRCGHGGPVQVDARAFQRRFFRLDAGLILVTGRYRVIGVLTGDAVIFDQHRVALGFLAIGDDQRLGLFKRCGGFVKRRAIA